MAGVGWVGVNLFPFASLFYFVLFQRGHTVRAVCESFQLSKDAGFKVIAHMMPDLPNVGLERDIQQFIVSIIASFFIIILFYVEDQKVNARQKKV